MLACGARPEEHTHNIQNRPLRFRAGIAHVVPLYRYHRAWSGALWRSFFFHEMNKKQAFLLTVYLVFHAQFQLKFHSDAYSLAVAD